MRPASCAIASLRIAIELEREAALVEVLEHLPLLVGLCVARERFERFDVARVVGVRAAIELVRARAIRERTLDDPREPHERVRSLGSP